MKRVSADVEAWGLSAGALSRVRDAYGELWLTTVIGGLSYPDIQGSLGGPSPWYLSGEPLPLSPGSERHP
jgi:hypothetical protein